MDPRVKGAARPPRSGPGGNHPWNDPPLYLLIAESGRRHVCGTTQPRRGTHDGEDAAADVLALGRLAAEWCPGANRAKASRPKPLPQALQAVFFAALRGGVLALFFLALRAGYRLLRGRDGIGLGDVKLAAVAGAWLSWLAISIAVEIAALAAIAAFALRHYAAGRPLNAALKFPFVLFLAPSIWLGWLIDVTVLSVAN